jgi:hypothetical protein
METEENKGFGPFSFGNRPKEICRQTKKTVRISSRDRVMLKVSPLKGIARFGKKGKLAPMYVGPFVILQRIGPVAYKLQLPQELSNVQNVFHVPNLKKCLH